MTFTRLTLGEPRLRGRPKGGSVSSCTEESEYGANILSDPGAENLTTGGPGGQELPGYDFDGKLLYSDGSQVLFAPYYSFYQFGASGDTDDTLVVSTANPRSGSSHIRGGPDWSADVMLATADLCPPYPTPVVQGLSDSFGPFYSALVEPGDFYDTSCWVYYVHSGTPVDQSNTALDIWYWDSDHEFVTSVGTAVAEDWNLYYQIQFDAVIPSGVQYITVQFSANVVDGADDWEFVDWDDFTLEVQP